MVHEYGAPLSTICERAGNLGKDGDGNIYRQFQSIDTEYMLKGKWTEATNIHVEQWLGVKSSGKV